ncbi:MAG TPA: NADH-quinone oxidoreductase subunit J [Chthonomonadales bacterium]|nr:NADH-quinone oxidoreductase subunit J [Chthonomonadales bacterium]
MSAQMVLFAVLATLSVVTAILVVVHRNPVRSALSLVCNLIVLAVLYLTLSAQFVAAIQIIVYAGAIMVLFLFTVMLLNLGAPEALRETGRVQGVVGVALGLSFLAAILGAGTISAGLGPSAATEESLRTGGTAEAIGRHMFEPGLPWHFAFELTSVLLLVGIVGAVVLAKRRL